MSFVRFYNSLTLGLSLLDINEKIKARWLAEDHGLNHNQIRWLERLEFVYLSDHLLDRIIHHNDFQNLLIALSPSGTQSQPFVDENEQFDLFKYADALHQIVGRTIKVTASTVKQGLAQSITRRDVVSEINVFDGGQSRIELVCGGRHYLFVTEKSAPFLSRHEGPMTIEYGDSAVSYSVAIVEVL